MLPRLDQPLPRKEKAGGLVITYVFVNCPVKDIVILKPFSYKEIPKNLSQIRVIRLIIKPQRASIIKIDGKLVGEAFAKHLRWCSHFFLHNAIIFLLFGSSLESLPRKRATTEVKHDITQRLHIITPGLLCWI